MPALTRLRRCAADVTTSIVAVGIVCAVVLGGAERTGLSGAPSDSYALTRIGGRVAVLDGCRFAYVVNDAADRTGRGIADVHDAFNALSEATGVEFSYLGPTGERADAEPRPEGAPILVAWSELGDGAGAGGPTVEERAGGVVIVSGVATVNPHSHAAGRAGLGEGAGLGAVLLHELGHLVGLDHAPGGVMSPTLDPDRPATYGPGDLAGLAEIGRAAGCLQAG